MMFPYANIPVPMKPTANMMAATIIAPLTPMAFSIWDPNTAPKQKVIIMILKVRPTADFSSPNVAHMGAANIENA